MVPKRRQPKLALLGLLCLILGGSGLYLAYQSISATEEILVAARSIAAGQVLGPADVKSVPVIIGAQLAAVPVDYPITGSVALTDIGLGEPIVAAALGSPATGRIGLVRLAVVIAVGLAPVEAISEGGSVSLFGPDGEMITATVASPPERLLDAAHDRFDVLLPLSEAPLLAQWLANETVLVTIP